MVNTNWNAPAIIDNCNRIVRINFYFNICAVPCKCFIYRIVHNFIYKMVEPPCGRTANMIALLLI